MNGDQIIGLALIQGPDHNLHGSYFYKKYLKDIPLKGEFTAARDIDLREYDDSGSVRATFHLHFAESDPAFKKQSLDKEVLTGTWVSKSRSYPVHLSLEDAIFVSKEKQRYEALGVTDKTAFEHEAEKFYFAVLKGNKQTASRQIEYPMRIYMGNKRITFRSATEFLKHWDELFTPAYLACVSEGIPHDMFANYQGAMIGRGEIWWNEKGRVSAINPCVPSQK